MIFKGGAFDPQSVGIGGLNAQIKDICRRALASRMLQPHLRNNLEMLHVRGILLHGPPGTGKTLLAREIGNMLHAVETKIVSGPELLEKYSGEAEKKVRSLFKDAETDEKKYGDASKLHLTIFDEIDSICRKRTNNPDMGFLDGILNQLLSKIDGVTALNNILIIGTTNLIDEATKRKQEEQQPEPT